MHNLDARVSGAAPFPFASKLYEEDPSQRLQGPAEASEATIDAHVNFGLIRGLMVAAALALPFWIGLALLLHKLQ